MGVESLMRQTITISRNTGRDKHAKPTSENPTDYKCRFEQVSMSITSATNERTPITGRVFLQANCPADINDKALFNGRTYRVMRIAPIVDGSGATRHKEAMLADWVYNG